MTALEVSVADRDALVCRLIEHWADNRGYFLVTYTASLRARTYEFSEAEIMHAMDIALGAPRDSYWRYFQGVLVRWQRYGYGNVGPVAAGGPPA